MNQENTVGEIVFHTWTASNGTYSVVARLWDPSKKIFEHPEYIELTLEDSIQKTNELVQQFKLLDEEEVARTIKSTWLLIST